MAYTYEELQTKNLAELRDVAKDIQHDAVQGFTQMNKEHLLPALCAALGIDAREHHTAHGEGKAAARARMARGLMTYPMPGTIDGRRGDHILLAPPFIVEDSHLELIVDRMSLSKSRKSRRRKQRIGVRGKPFSARKRLT